MNPFVDVHSLPYFFNLLHFFGFHFCPFFFHFTSPLHAPHPLASPIPAQFILSGSQVALN